MQINKPFKYRIMKKLLKSSVTMLLISLINFTYGQEQFIDTTWTVRTDYVTPIGQPDSTWTKEVNIVVNLHIAPTLGSVMVRIGTEEGASDLYYSETILTEGQPALPATISGDGFLIIPAGQYTIDPEHFFVEILLFDTYNQPLNQ
jgi:hypothetical protein